VRCADGVLRNRGIYGADGKLERAQPMSLEEFRNGAKDDELVCVFEDGALVNEQDFADVKARAKITDLDGALTKALDNLHAKAEFLQTMASPEACAVRLAEASCGSKWMHKHPSKMAQISKDFPHYKAVLERLGFTDGMDSLEVVAHIKENHMCDKAASKRVFRALDDDDVEAAIAGRAGKAVLTL
jgi:hypothetical protein